jgi:hypothetical protein
MKNQIADVLAFHVKMGLEYAAHPKQLREEAVNRRIRLIEEEFDEFIESWERDDYIGQIDALMDLLYVTYGTLVEMGILNAQPFWDEVQRSNMTKIGGYENEYGKWVKPDTYSAANLTGVFDTVYGALPKQSCTGD